MEENKEKKVKKTKKTKHKSVNHGKNKVLTVEQIQEAYEKKQVFDALVQDVDNLYNLHMVFANGIPAIMPREEVSSIVGEDGLVETKTCLALKGKVRYFPDVMSVYRLGTPDSWTDRMKDIKMQLQTERELIDILKSVDKYTNYELHAAVQPIREKRLLRILNKETKISVLKSKELYEVFRMQTLTAQVKICIKLLFLNKIRYRKF